MAKIIKFVKGVRNHWKKAIFAAGAISYGISYGYEKYEINNLMREYCTEAAKYGDVTEKSTEQFKKIIVLINPVANKRTGIETFEKYCAPILHLAGLAIEIVKTDSEGHARRYIEDLEKLPDAILIAGGDGTISEAVTGLLRRSQNDTCNIGVLPIGRENTIAKKLYKFSLNSKLDEIRGIANATMSIVRGKTELKDVMKIEILPTFHQKDGNATAEEQPSIPLKPVYAVGALEWGAFRDVFALRDQYWYVNGLREYFAVLFNAFSNNLSWNCNAKLSYTLPCSGCNNCYQLRRQYQSNLVDKPNNNTNRWWYSFTRKNRLGTAKQAETNIDYSKIQNINCNTVIEINVKSSELLLNTKNIEEENNETDESKKMPKLLLRIDDNQYSSLDFILNSWKRLHQSDRKNINIKNENIIAIRTIELIPNNSSTNESEKFFSIDNEEYEVKPIKISLIPNAIKMYSL